MSFLFYSMLGGQGEGHMCNAQELLPAQVSLLAVPGIPHEMPDIVSWCMCKANVLPNVRASVQANSNADSVGHIL